MKYSLLFIFSLFLINPVIAQETSTVIRLEDDTGKRYYEKAGRETEGTPYLHKDWEKGHVLFKSGQKSDLVDLKYNVHLNQVIFERDGELLQVLPNTLDGFVFLEKNEQKVFLKGFKSEENDINPALFLRMIYDGKVKLVAKHTTKFKEARDPNPITGKIIDKFIPKTDFYLITEDGKFHDIKLKDKNILEALNSHQKQLKNYAKKKNLSFKNENDLRSILLEYDNLLKMKK